MAASISQRPTILIYFALSFSLCLVCVCAGWLRRAQAESQSPADQCSGGSEEEEEEEWSGVKCSSDEVVAGQVHHATS
jgi:hypothetical protein